MKIAKKTRTVIKLSESEMELLKGIGDIDGAYGVDRSLNPCCLTVTGDDNSIRLLERLITELKNE